MISKTIKKILLTLAITSMITSNMPFIDSVRASELPKTNLVVKALPITIKTIADITETANQNDKYTLPSTVKAIMSDGSSKSVAITWDKKVDTSKAGTFTYTGTVSGYANNVKLTLVVKSVVPTLSNVTVTSEAGITANGIIDTTKKTISFNLNSISFTSNIVSGTGTLNKDATVVINAYSKSVNLGTVTTTDSLFNKIFDKVKSYGSFTTGIPKYLFIYELNGATIILTDSEGNSTTYTIVVP